MLEKTENKENMVSHDEIVDPTWRTLLKLGGSAALLAGVLFRRNFGPEISLFMGTMPPSAALDWFTLLQGNWLLGLIFLGLFDLIDYALVCLMFLALYIPLRRTDASYMAIATVLGLIGAAVYFASNAAFSMLSLSNQYAVATTEAQRDTLLAAGEAILAIGYQGTGIYTSFLLLAIAGLTISFVMLRNSGFSRTTAYVGILAGIFDLIYCVSLAVMPVMGVLFVSGAGLLLMIWHILVGRNLCLLGQRVR